MARLSALVLGLGLVIVSSVSSKHIAYDVPFESFYNLCASSEDTVKCGGAWKASETENNACLESRNCTNALAVEKTDEDFVFHLLATDDAEYVALGFSQDQKMGGEPVVACVVDNGTITGILSYNEGHRNIPAESNEALLLDEGQIQDGSIYCKFRLTDPLTFARHFDNNTDQDFYVVGVAGPLTADGTALAHHTRHIVPSEKWSFSSASSVAATSFLLSTMAAILLVKC